MLLDVYGAAHRTDQANAAVLTKTFRRKKKMALKSSLLKKHVILSLVLVFPAFMLWLITAFMLWLIPNIFIFMILQNFEHLSNTLVTHDTLARTGHMKRREKRYFYCSL